MKKTFEVKEDKGKLPYVVIWISLDGRFRAVDYINYNIALDQFNFLISIKRQPSIYLNINPELISPK